MTTKNEIERLQELYTNVYLPDPKDRNYIYHPRNPIGLYYRQAQERAIITSLNKLNIQLIDLRVLDVGCGSGGVLRFLASLGAQPKNLQGIDIVFQRCAVAKRLCPPMVSLFAADAAHFPFSACSFDLICQFGMLSSILATQFREEIAYEMMRALKPGGLILWYDAQTKASGTTRGIHPDEIQALFPGFEILLIEFLHLRYTSRLARVSLALASLAEFLPLAKTHLLVILKAPPDGPQ